MKKIRILSIAVPLVFLVSCQTAPELENIQIQHMSTDRTGTVGSMGSGPPSPTTNSNNSTSSDATNTEHEMGSRD